MKLAIVAYGDPVLRKKAEPLTKDYPGLQKLIDNMFDTMYGANGVGLAAPQVGVSVRLFISDASAYSDSKDEVPQKKVYINPEIVSKEEKKVEFEEGCLSIPGIREKLSRPDKITVRYFDENFTEHNEELEGLMARVFQHEFDHIEGILFTDYVSTLKKAMLKGRLGGVSKGDVKVDYKMKFPNLKKVR